MNTETRSISHTIGAVEYGIPNYNRTRDKMISVVEDKLIKLRSGYSVTCLTDLVTDYAMRAISNAKSSIDEQHSDQECFNILDQLNLASARLSRMIATMENEKRHPL